jgi:hypothetical protein
MLSRLDDALRNLDKAKPFAGRRDFREGPPRLRGGGGNRPGSFVPAPSPDGIFF